MGVNAVSTVPFAAPVAVNVPRPSAVAVAAVFVYVTPPTAEPPAVTTLPPTFTR